MVHILESEQWLPFSVPMVFAFLANPQNLPPLMPAWQQARIEELRLIAPPAPPAGSPSRLGTGVGTTMILSFRMLPGLPMRMNWHAAISEFEWNDHFVDRQTAGPFAFWRHRHSVKEEMRDGVPGTLAKDRVEYKLPLGPVGDLLHTITVRAQMERIFAYRKKRMAELMP
ncbi:SRPBCC family protein [Terriglobus roseus]|uniref:Ligand-binding SRPBCC domain-containing protein n=1 Tax=Terriglobus roseus TaxID=392734 RepID=A0A1G7LFQ0_9BACT|nr:SRPBCC family protein [Terriglobus roseus]SDF47840.1 Ligand-binding SRPBCC domain-containing protein [Terriglobus roseus]